MKLKTMLAVAITFLHLIPFYVLVMLAFKSQQDTSSKWQPPAYFTLQNFSDAWKHAHLDQAFLSNIVITFAVVILVVLIGAMAAYPLARYRTKWNNFIYTVCVSCLIVPPLTTLVPLYKFMVDIHGINTYWGIILVQITFSLPISIFLLVGFMGTVPKELDEAAMIDGCTRFSVFSRIIIRLLKPIIATIIILIGVQVWNDYQFSVFFLQKKSVQTIPVALSFFFSQFSNNVNWVAAGCLTGMLPLTLVYLFLQKYFIKGMVDGAIKG